TYASDPLVAGVRATVPVPVLVIVTFALGTTAPVGSVTVPVIVPAVCAWVRLEAQTARSATTNTAQSLMVRMLVSFALEPRPRKQAHNIRCHGTAMMDILNNILIVAIQRN